MALMRCGAVIVFVARHPHCLNTSGAVRSAPLVASLNATSTAPLSLSAPAYAVTKINMHSYSVNC
jgi:hypothetical protein